MGILSGTRYGPGSDSLPYSESGTVFVACVLGMIVRFMSRLTWMFVKPPMAVIIGPESGETARPVMSSFQGLFAGRIRSVWRMPSAVVVFQSTGTVMGGVDPSTRPSWFFPDGGTPR